MYKQNPAMYEGYGQLNAGYIMSIIGTCLGGLYAIYYIVIVTIIGTGAASVWHLNQ